MPKKSILLVDDDQFFLEPLVDGLTHEGFQVKTARTVQEAIALLERERFDLLTIDIMMDPGDDLIKTVDTHSAGLHLARVVKRKYPNMDAFCISVVSDSAMIDEIQGLGIRFLRKGETPLRTVLNMIRSKLTGLAYSSERDDRRRT